MVPPTVPPDSDDEEADEEEKENFLDRGYRWVKAHPRVVILLVRVIPLGMLLLGFAVILWIKLKAIGVW